MASHPIVKKYLKAFIVCTLAVVFGLGARLIPGWLAMTAFGQWLFAPTPFNAYLTTVLGILSIIGMAVLIVVPIADELKVIQQREAKPKLPHDFRTWAKQLLKAIYAIYTKPDKPRT